MSYTNSTYQKNQIIVNYSTKPQYKTIQYNSEENNQFKQYETA